MAKRDFYGTFIEPFLTEKDHGRSIDSFAAAANVTDTAFKNWLAYKPGMPDMVNLNQLAADLHCEEWPCSGADLARSYTAYKMAKDRDKPTSQALERRVARVLSQLDEQTEMLGDAGTLLKAFGGGEKREVDKAGRTIDTMAAESDSSLVLDKLEELVCLLGLCAARPPRQQYITTPKRLSVLQLVLDARALELRDHEMGNSELLAKVSEVLRAPKAEKRLGDEARRGARLPSPKCLNDEHRLWKTVASLDIKGIREERLRKPSTPQRQAEFQDYLERLNADASEEAEGLDCYFLLAAAFEDNAFLDLIKRELKDIPLYQSATDRGERLFAMDLSNVEVWLAKRFYRIENMRGKLNRPTEQTFSESIPKESTVNNFHIHGDNNGNVANGDGAQQLQVNSNPSDELKSLLKEILDKTDVENSEHATIRAAARSAKKSIDSDAAPEKEDLDLLKKAAEGAGLAKTITDIAASIVGTAVKAGYLE